jgi:Zinc knuckle
MSASSDLNPFVFDLDTQENWNRYRSQVLSDASKMGIAKYFQDDYVFRDRPTIDPAPMPANFPGDAARWDSMRLDLYRAQLSRWSDDLLGEESNWEKACGVVHGLLGEGPRKAVHILMKIVDPQERFLEVQDYLQTNYCTHGGVPIAHLLNQMQLVDDSLGIKNMFDQMTNFVNQIVEIDDTRRPTDDYLKGILCSNVRRPFWVQYCAGLITRLGTTYADMKEDMLAIIRDMKQVEDPDFNPTKVMVTNVESKKFKRVAYPWGTCFNCGQPGHTASSCTALTCGFCGKTWPNVNTPGRHTSNDRSERIAAQRASVGGRNAGPGGRGGRSGPGRGGSGRGRGSGGRGRGNPNSSANDSKKKSSGAVDTQNSKKRPREDSNDYSAAFSKVSTALDKIVKRLDDASI